MSTARTIAIVVAFLAATCSGCTLPGPSEAPTLMDVIGGILESMNPNN